MNGNPLAGTIPSDSLLDERLNFGLRQPLLAFAQSRFELHNLQGLFGLARPR